MTNPPDFTEAFNAYRHWLRAVLAVCVALLLLAALG